MIRVIYVLYVALSLWSVLLCALGLVLPVMWVNNGRKLIISPKRAGLT